MNNTSPQGEVIVEQRHKDFAGRMGNCQCERCVNFRAGIFLEFERDYLASLASPADVAVREAGKELCHQFERLRAIVRGESPSLLDDYDGGTIPDIDGEKAIATWKAALSAPTPPDQPQIGDEKLVEALEHIAEDNDDGATCAEIARQALAARAAIAAMPKEDIWEEAALVAETHFADPRMDSAYRAAGASIAAALRDRRAK